MRRTIELGDNVLDSRDIIERIAELEDSEDEDDIEELKLWKEFEEEQCASDWQYGETFILDSYFEDYAEELASDLYGSQIDSAHWPFTCIDWEKAARELQYDYSSVDIGEYTYWYRS